MKPTLQKRTAAAPGSAAAVCSPQNGANDSRKVLSLKEAIALNEETLRAAGERAGVADITKLPAKAQNAIARGGGYQLIAVAQIVRSPFNRTEFDPEKMAEMVASVRTHGVLEPILVRPVKDGEWFIDPVSSDGWKTQKFQVTSRTWIATLRERGSLPFIMPTFRTEAEAQRHLPRFELIAGERRWKAATEAKLELIPAIVRELGDRETIELQIIENLQREDVRPMDEARSYQRLIEFGYKIDELVEKLHRSKSSIYGRLKLLELPEDARKACEEGRLPASHAELITRVEDPAAQAKVAAAMLKPEETRLPGSYQRVERDVVSFREAKALVDEAEKEVEREAAWQAQTAEYRDKGYKVLTLAQSENVFTYGSLKASYVGVGDKCDLDPQGRTWKSLLGQHAPSVLVAKGGWESKLRLVYPRKAAEKALKLAGHDFGSKESQRENKETARKREEEQRKQDQERKLARDGANIAKVVSAVEAREPNSDTWRFIAWALQECWCDGLASLLKRRGISVEGKAWDAGEKAVRALIAKSDARALRGIVVELLLWDWHGADEKRLEQLAGMYKVKVQTSGK